MNTTAKNHDEIIQRGTPLATSSGHITQAMMDRLLTENDAQDAALLLLALQGKAPPVPTHEQSRDTHIEISFTGAAFWLALAATAITWLLLTHSAPTP